jgi:hypothetical protein
VVSEINLTIGGRSMRRLTVPQLRALNAFNGAIYNGNDLNTLVIHLREPWLTDPRDQHALSWGMGGVTSFRVEVTLKTPLTNPALSGSYVADEGRDDKGNLLGIGVIKKTKTDFQGVTNTGDMLVRNLSFEGVVKRLHLESSAITSLDFRANGRSVFEVDTANLASFYASQLLVAQSGYQTINFDQLNHLALGVVAGSLANSEIKVTNSAATSFNIVHEFLAPALG